ncbi:MAG: glycosyltransferase family 2 protein [Aerococcus sp.]|nr:glycosyltransferase family 2 protein [Aerococcus sp.]
MLISIIVPIYNTEKTLERAVQSLTQQTYEDIEIILVDDGSTDESGAIADQLAEQDERIRVIHQENAGPSVARNNGIAAAAGDYIAFLDSDDEFETYILELFMESYHHRPMDIFIFNIERVFSDRKQVRNSTNAFYTDMEQAVAALFTYNGVDFYVHNKIFNAELFQNVTFPVGKLYEDMNPIYDLVAQAHAVEITNQIGIRYYDTSDSLTTETFRPRQVESITERLILHQKVKRDFPSVTGKSARRLLDGFLGVAEKLAMAKKNGYPKFEQFDQKLKRYYAIYQEDIEASNELNWKKHWAWWLYTQWPAGYAMIYHLYLGQGK